MATDSRSISAPVAEPIRAGVSAAALAAYFLKLGAVGFGGPAALAERMRRDLVDDRGWLTTAEYELGLAIATACPGPLAYQLAVFCGHARQGLAGALAVAVAFVLSPFLLVIALGLMYDSFAGHPVVRGIFAGVGPVTVALIFRACWNLGRKTLGGHWLTWLLGATGAVLTAVSGREPTALFVVAGLIGVAWLRPVGVARPPAPGPKPGHESAASSATRRTPVSMAVLAPLSLATGHVAPLFWFFFKTGCLVFGSGLVIVPFLHAAVVDQFHWLDERQFVDAVSVGLISPGPVVITATFVGHVVAGFPGAVAATVGMFLPAVLFTVVAAPFFARRGDEPWVRGLVRGITAAVVGVLAGTVPLVARSAVPDLTAVLIAAGALVVLTRRAVPEPLVVAGGAAIGIALAL